MIGVDDCGASTRAGVVFRSGDRRLSLQKPFAAHLAHHLDCALPIAVRVDDKRLIVGNALRSGSPDVATMTAGNQVTRVVVHPVAVDVIADESVWRVSQAVSPSHFRLAPMAAVQPIADFLKQYPSAEWHRNALRANGARFRQRERVVLPNFQRWIHAVALVRARARAKALRVLTRPLVFWGEFATALGACAHVFMLAHLSVWSD